jgi:hypothetical protein
MSRAGASAQSFFGGGRGRIADLCTGFLRQGVPRDVRGRPRNPCSGSYSLSSSDSSSSCSFMQSQDTSLHAITQVSADFMDIRSVLTRKASLRDRFYVGGVSPLVITHQRRTHFKVPKGKRAVPSITCETHARHPIHVLDASASSRRCIVLFLWVVTGASFLLSLYR